MLQQRLNHYMLRRMPRYKPTKAFLNGKYINVVDGCTFMHGYDEIFTDKIYEFQHSSDAPYIIDCGANIGLATLYFKELYPKSRILAFEPDPTIFKTLQQNISIFGYKDVEAIGAAVWTENGTISFQIEGGFSGRIPKEGDKDAITTVKSIRLKDYLKEQVDFLKIDIEGAEYEVLKDCKDELRNVENIFIEYHSHIKEKQTLHEILELLLENNFRYHIKEAFSRKRPFVDKDKMLNMDLQLNIFGYKERN